MMMKVENIFYFWLSPTRKYKFNNFFYRHQIRKNNFRKICFFETLDPQKLILYSFIPQVSALIRLYD